MQVLVKNTDVYVCVWTAFPTHSTSTLLLGMTSIGFAFATFTAINLLYRHIDEGFKQGKPQVYLVTKHK